MSERSLVTQDGLLWERGLTFYPLVRVLSEHGKKEVLYVGEGSLRVTIMEKWEANGATEPQGQRLKLDLRRWRQATITSPSPNV